MGLAVCIHGPSGIGKTALVQHFLDPLADRDDVVVLRGRCYEHESVPYKALDGIIDSLSAYLSSLPPFRTAELIPREIGALARAFPVMLRVEAVASAARSEVENPDPSAQRRLAFSALRELLGRIAARDALVLYIDDLHWADSDSTLLLGDLLRPPGPPPLLMLACLRTEEIALKPFFQALVDGAGAFRCTALRLEPMTDDEAREVIAGLTYGEARIDQTERLELSREAGGNPFLLEQLAQYVAVHDTGGTRKATLADMLERRLRGLPDGARRFLEVLAVCGRPMAPQLVHDAVGLAGDERSLVAILRADHLLRNSGSASRIEVYHDRIRETLAAQLSPDQVRGIHALLVRTLTARGADDPEALFEHCRGAGDRDGAAHQAVRAARKAHSALAFDRAALFYRSALELAPHDPAVAEWKQGLAESLTNAGRPQEAAEVYLDASRGAERRQQVELQRRAAEQYLVGGNIDRGMEVIRTVLGTLNMRLASGPLTALASLSWWYARLRLRGLDFVTRDARHIPSKSLLRIDTCWSVVTGLATVDSIRAASFNTRHLLLALDAGEPYRVARALALEAGFLKTGGTRLRYGALCAERGARAAAQSGEPHAQALLALSEGMASLLAGEWKQASLLCEQALDILREHCSGATWELNCAESFLLGALLFQGEIGEVSRRLPPLLTAARDRGNLYFETELRTRMNLVWLAADQPDEGERHANEAMQGWSHQGFHRQHYNHALARIQTALYCGRAEVAWDLVTSNWRAFERTLLLRVQFLRIEASYLHARAALLMAAGGRDAGRFLSIAREDVRRIERCKRPWGDAIAMLLAAAVINLEGRSREAEERLGAAVTAFEGADMKLYAAVARRRLGALRHDDGGRELVREADHWMADQGISHTGRMSRLIAPGLPDPEEF